MIAISVYLAAPAADRRIPFLEARVMNLREKLLVLARRCEDRGHVDPRVPRNWGMRDVAAELRELAKDEEPDVERLEGLLKRAAEQLEDWAPESGLPDEIYAALPDPAPADRPNLGDMLAQVCGVEDTTRATTGERVSAPPNSLPTWPECCLRVENSEHLAKRKNDGGYGPEESDAPQANELHRFIYEYDDADPYRSAWFLHRLELVLEEARRNGVPTDSAPADRPKTDCTTCGRPVSEHTPDRYGLACPDRPEPSEALQEIVDRVYDCGDVDAEWLKDRADTVRRHLSQAEKELEGFREATACGDAETCRQLWKPVRERAEAAEAEAARYKDMLRRIADGPRRDSMTQCQMASEALQSAPPASEAKRILAKHQPCGCVVCTCEDEDQCHGCGATHCGTHPLCEIPNPVYATAPAPATCEFCGRETDPDGESMAAGTHDIECPRAYTDPAPADRLLDEMAADVDSMTDEELRAEAAEDGITAHRVRQTIERAVASADGDVLNKERRAIEASLQFVDEMIKPLRCDSEAVASCVRCQTVYLANVLREALAQPNESGNRNIPVGDSPNAPQTPDRPTDRPEPSETLEARVSKLEEVAHAPVDIEAVVLDVLARERPHGASVAVPREALDALDWLEDAASVNVDDSLREAVINETGKVRRALSQPVPAVPDAWRPIETAPKDGTEFLSVNGRCMNTMQLVRYNRIRGYFESKGEPKLGFLNNATAWMPKPAAPQGGHE